MPTGRACTRTGLGDTAVSISAPVISASTPASSAFFLNILIAPMHHSHATFRHERATVRLGQRLSHGGCAASASIRCCLHGIFPSLCFVFDPRQVSDDHDAGAPSVSDKQVRFPLGIKLQREGLDSILLLLVPDS